MNRPFKKKKQPVWDSCPQRLVVLGGQGVTISQVDSADGAGDVVLSGRDQRLTWDL